MVRMRSGRVLSATSQRDLLQQRKQAGQKRGEQRYFGTENSTKSYYITGWPSGLEMRTNLARIFRRASVGSQVGPFSLVNVAYYSIKHRARFAQCRAPMATD